MNEGAGILRANALRLPLADASVDLIVTSPPYFALRSYRDDDAHYSGQIGSEETPQAFLEALWAVTAECWRVLKPTGSCFVNLGDKYANDAKWGGASNAKQQPSDEPASVGYRQRQRSGAPAKSLIGLPWRYAIGCIDGLAAPDAQRWILRAEVIWSKPNGLPESVTDRVRRSHEQLFHFVKSPRYFSAVDEVRETQATPERQGTWNGARGEERTDGVSRDRGWQAGTIDYNPLGKLPGSVWTIPSEPLLIPEAVQRHYDLPDHFAAFPQELPRRIILGWSPNGVCVECGEGRRPVVAKEYVPARARGGDGSISRVRPAKSQLGDSSAARKPGGFNDTVLDKDVTITGYACSCFGGEDSASRALPAVLPAVVLDPFGGTGTTAMVARTLGRFGISVDLSADYNRLAKWRIWESGHGEKAAQRTWRENQGDLFGNAPSPFCEDVAVEEAL